MLYRFTEPRTWVTDKLTLPPRGKREGGLPAFQLEEVEGLTIPEQAQQKASPCHLLVCLCVAGDLEQEEPLA